MPVTGGPTIADGLAVPTVGVNAFETAAPLVDRMVSKAATPGQPPSARNPCRRDKRGMRADLTYLWLRVSSQVVVKEERERV